MPDIVPVQPQVVFPGCQACPVSGVGACFYCGEFGHFRRNCPKAPGGATAVANQYPFERYIYNDCDVYDLLPVGSQECEGQVPDAMWELDIDELCTMRVQGGLKQKLSYWVDVLNAPDRVMEHGYVLPLFSSPTLYCGCNHTSALENCDFVSLAIQELLVNICVIKVDSQPFICSPLSVV